jgi:hypothetical protein
MQPACLSGLWIFPASAVCAALLVADAPSVVTDVATWVSIDRQVHGMRFHTASGTFTAGNLSKEPAGKSRLDLALASPAKREHITAVGRQAKTA